MITPYDWQEGIGNRAQYVETRLSQGVPVVGVSLEQGVLLTTLRKNTPKLYEIYDRIGFGAIGLQSDIEAIRVAAVDFAHREGYGRSEADVTGHRVVTALTAPLKRAFGEFNSSPFVIRGIFAEVGETAAEDHFFLFEYDGDFTPQPCNGVVAGTEAVGDAICARMSEVSATSKPDVAAKAVMQIIRDSLSEAQSAIEGLSPEAILIERGDHRENRFRTVEVP
jgi:proteasome alpha subunit